MDGESDGNLRRETADLQRGTGGRRLEGRPPFVVAAVHTAATLRAMEALRDQPGIAPDLLELRVDQFAHNARYLEEKVQDPPRPLIVTVRRSDEGGGPPALDHGARAALYRRFLPVATFLDVEARSLEALAGVVEEAHAAGVGVITSFHDFQGTPEPSRLEELAGQAAAAGASVFKVAAVVDSPSDLARLLDFHGRETRLPLALMGMGRLGRMSRLVLVAAGSVLAYGYLGAEAQVSGQWPVGLLRERLDELREG